jgi:charged multivesicular body protein 6
MIEEQMLLIESTKNQKDVMSVISQGNKVLRELQKEVNIEKWEKISDDLNDLKNNQSEIASFFMEKGVNISELDKTLDMEVEKLISQVEKESLDPINNFEKLLPEATSKTLYIKDKRAEKKIEEDYEII